MNLQYVVTKRSWTLALDKELVWSFQIEHLSIVGDLDAWWEGLHTDRQSDVSCLHDCFFCAYEPCRASINTNPTTVIDFSLIPTHCIALTRDVNTNAPKEPQPPPVLTAFTICNHFINHLSLKLLNQKGNKTKGKASVSSPCSLETPGWVPAWVRSKPKALRTISDKNGHLRLFLFIDKSKPKKTFFCT